MRYDDRLRTVLAQPADHPHDRAVRWRQLVELLARGGESCTSPMFEQAITVVVRDSPLVDEQVRMAAARAIASLAAPCELVRAFAADRLTVAAPVLAAAKLTAADWAKVAEGASPECRRFIASLRADVPVEEPDHEPAPVAEVAPPPPAAVPPSDSPIPSISEVVARIERLRQARQGGEAEPIPAPPESAEPPRLFRWECDEAGDIAWVEGVPRGAVIGRSIARSGDPAELDPGVERAFSMRMPFSDARLELAEGGVAGGAWKISGMPAFDPSNGRFSGYRGIAERDQPRRQEVPLFAARDPDSLRELVHEIKTPLNAIIGFAEIISSEYLGPADQPYRDRAATIVAQARLLLTAIDDLDLAARLHAQQGSSTVDLHDVIGRVAAELGESGARFDISGPATTSVDLALAERLVSRFCQTAVAMSRAAQSFSLTADEDNCVLSAVNPGLDPKAELHLGLRLVLGLARVAGGDVWISRDRIKLLLPRA